ncbi:transposase [Streptomyces sp. NPDC018610]|uniref:transposase n=1 Tax=Streptomyces sp. NPDC018610 TaxID=3365049 RepID=UPI0037BA796E
MPVGIGPDSAVTVLITMGDNPERLNTEASFAALCGVSPAEAEYETHLSTVHAADAASDPQSEPLLRRRRRETSLRLALLEHKRSAVIALRDRHRIDDAVLLRVQERLDAEEVRLAQLSQDQ